MNIWSEKNAERRRKFINWLCRYFRYSSSVEPITITMLSDLFNTMNPNAGPIWTDDEIDELLYDIGYLHQNNNYFTASLKVQEMTDLSKDALLKFMEVADQDSRKEIRKLLMLEKTSTMLKEAGTVKPINFVEGQSLNMFYNLWCVDCRIVPWNNEIKPTYRRAVVSDVIRAYKAFCVRNNIVEVDYKTLRIFLSAKGHKSASGYACGRSGQSYYTNLYVPGGGFFKDQGGFYDEEELSMATRYNMLIIRNGSKYYTNTGAELLEIRDDYIDNVVSRRIDDIKIDTSKFTADEDTLLDDKDGICSNYLINGMCKTKDIICDGCATDNIINTFKDNPYLDVSKLPLDETDEYTEVQLEGPTEGPFDLPLDEADEELDIELSNAEYDAEVTGVPVDVISIMKEQMSKEEDDDASLVASEADEDEMGEEAKKILERFGMQDKIK